MAENSEAPPALPTPDALEARIRLLLPTLDLDKMSARSVRNILEGEFKTSLKPHKQLIDSIIMKVFEEQSPAERSEPAESKPSKKRKREEVQPDEVGEEFCENAEQGGEPDTDVELARKLQEEEKRRSSRVSRTVRPAPTKKASAKPAGSSRKGGFQKPSHLSPALADFMGTEIASRPEVVKKLWEHIKKYNLQDPKNRRRIVLDDTLQKVFKNAKSVTMFSMNKLLAPHIKPVEDSV